MTQTHDAETFHLWEVDHPYYMNEGNYYKAGEHTSYANLDDFLCEWGEADIDMNRVHRWDWDDETGTLSVFFVMQRKARLMSCDVVVCHEDEARVIEYLTPHMNRERAIWHPLSALPPQEVSVQEAAKVLLNNCPNPIFDTLKPVLMGEFSQSYPFFDEDGEEVFADVNISWTVTKEIIAAALRALSENANE